MAVDFLVSKQQPDGSIPSTDIGNEVYNFYTWEDTAVAALAICESLPSIVEMASFIVESAKIEFKKKPDDDKIHVKGKFELDLDSVDISEDVIVTVGPFSETIKMEKKGKGDKWEYKRPKEETGIKDMKIDWKKNNEAKFDIRVDKLADMVWTNPVTINIQIGDDIGSETITMKVHKHHWDYHKKKP